MAVWKAEILIGDDVVWSTQTDTPQQTVQLAVGQYLGVHNLKFRLKLISGTPPAPVLGDDLFAYYEMEGVFPTKGLDSTPNNNDLDHSFFISDVAGKIGNAGNYPGGAGIPGIHEGPPPPPYHNDFNCNNITISVWVKTDNTFTGQAVAAKSDNAHNQWRITSWSANKKWAFALIAGGVGASITSNTVMTLNWIHLVATYDGINMKIYINGVLDGTAFHPVGGNITSYNIPVHIGARGDLPGIAKDIFDGKIDEVGFWSRALTQPEVTQLYNGGAGLSYAQIIAL